MNNFLSRFWNFLFNVLHYSFCILLCKLLQAVCTLWTNWTNKISSKSLAPNGTYFKFLVYVYLSACVCLSAYLSPADNVVVYANVLTGSSSKLENVQLQKIIMLKKL